MISIEKATKWSKIIRIFAKNFSNFNKKYKNFKLKIINLTVETDDKNFLYPEKIRVQEILMNKFMGIN